MIVVLFVNISYFVCNDIFHNSIVIGIVIIFIFQKKFLSFCDEKKHMMA